jgi:hypothetical protein
MHVFLCERCGHVVPFSAQECATCGAALGYVTEQRTLRMLWPTDDPAVYEIVGDDRLVWCCLNSAWGCNWVLSAGTDAVWCRSCGLTRGRPDEERPDAIHAWMSAEAAKRRLVHQLDAIGLPIERRGASSASGLAFDLVYLPGEGGITGHGDGVVTLDLAETDDRHRDDLRRRLGEPFRTVIGHLRHEIGHHYWSCLVAGAEHMARFRALFGDERVDYRTAVERYYSSVAVWDPGRHVTAYAAAHPLEDWAETFAHYLHILDAVDTAVAHRFVPVDSGGITVAGSATADDFTAVLDAWRPVNAAVNAIADSLGMPAIYPFTPSGDVVDKLGFVHHQVAWHTNVDRFDAAR